MMNRVILIGNLGADPEKTETPTGKTVVRFSIPLHNPFQREGEKTEWMQCEVWNKPADFLSQYAHKGDMVVVEGRLRNQRYETKTGEIRYRTFIAVDRVQLRNNNRTQGGNPAPNGQTGQAPTRPQQNAPSNPAPAQQNQSQNELDDLFSNFDFDM